MRRTRRNHHGLGEDEAPSESAWTKPSTFHSAPRRLGDSSSLMLRKCVVGEPTGFPRRAHSLRIDLTTPSSARNPRKKRGLASVSVFFPEARIPRFGLDFVRT